MVCEGVLHLEGQDGFIPPIWWYKNFEIFFQKLENNNNNNNNNNKVFTWKKEIQKNPNFF